MAVNRCPLSCGVGVPSWTGRLGEGEKRVWLWQGVATPGLRHSIVLDCGAIPILNAILPVNILFQILMFLQDQAGCLSWLLILNPPVV